MTQQPCPNEATQRRLMDLNPRRCLLQRFPRVGSMCEILCGCFHVQHNTNVLRKHQISVTENPENSELGLPGFRSCLGEPLADVVKVRPIGETVYVAIGALNGLRSSHPFAYPAIREVANHRQAERLRVAELLVVSFVIPGLQSIDPRQPIAKLD